MLESQRRASAGLVAISHSNSSADRRSATTSSIAWAE
jgi:hypothetical protein